MNLGRRDQTATLLLDGRVLIVDGTTTGAEIYNPDDGSFSPLPDPIYSHFQGLTATRLLDGRVLITGGYRAPGTAEIFDPESNTFSATSPLKVSRSFHTATLLADGKVLIAGGQNGDFSVVSAEIYDPALGTFSLTGNMTGDRTGHSATRLQNGNVLIIGGTHVTEPGIGYSQDIVEIYDPVTGTFRVTESMTYLASGHEATLLASGEVLVTRGTVPAEIFDPNLEAFRISGVMNDPRRAHTATLLTDGTVLLAGGNIAVGPVVTNSAEIFDPTTESFRLIPPMFSKRQQHSATLLLNGDVLVAGGTNGDVYINLAELYDGPPPPPPSGFTDSGISIEAVDEAVAAWADYDNDNDLDLLIAGTTNNGAITRLYRNSSNTLVESGIAFPAVDLAAADWGDYDNDGHIDFILTGRGTGNTHHTLLFRNTGSGFIEIDTNLHDLLAGSADWGDFDNDGDLDLLLTGRLSNLENFAGVFRNIDGVFTDINAGLTGIRRGEARWVDYDVDGDLDILTTGRFDDAITRRTILYRNAGGIFEEIDEGLPDVDLSSIDWGDFDNDGDPDLLIAGRSSTSGLITRIYRNNIGSFTDIGAGLSGLEFASVRWGDYDNDGDLDVLLSGRWLGVTPFAAVYQNNAGSFKNINANLTGVAKSAAAWGDYDKDGDLDAFITGQIDDIERVAKLYNNTTATPNIAPAAPAGLTHEIGTNYLKLSWGQGSDGQTPQAALSYNLRLGTTPGGNEIVAPHALETGWRQVAGTGNVQQKRSWIIKPLAPGTYYWSVQSIDHGFMGSAFAYEQSFVLVDPVLPVELTDFTAIYTNDRVVLNWTTLSEENNAGFEIQRIDENGTYEKIGFIDGRGTATESANYQFEDVTLPYGIPRLGYRLKQVDFDGGFTYSQIVYAEMNAPEAFTLLPNYPNPFNPTTEIRYEVPVGAEVQLTVYDMTGKEVAKLVDRWQEAGRYEVVFEASYLPSGIYLYRLDAAGATDVRKMVLVK